MPGQNIAYALEREIILEEKYQTSAETERYASTDVSFRDRFGLDIGWGYGYSYAEIHTQVYGPDPALKTYLNTLDMDFSTNMGIVRLRGRYMINPRLYAYLGAPMGFVEVKEEVWPKSLFEEEDIEAGIGDVSAGLQYFLFPETEKIPSTIVSFEVNSDTSEYYSLGDGLWGYTGGLRLTKTISDPYYLFGLGHYTHRVEDSGIDPGNITGYGGGIGLLLSEIGRIELGLRLIDFAETELNDVTLFEDDDNLTLFLSLYGEQGTSVHILLGNIDEEISSDRTTFGVEFSFPIF
jgi:hypothetical protein